MKASAVALGLISALAGAQSLEEGLARSLKLLLQLTGARAAGLVFFPRRGAPISVLVGTRGAPALDRWLRDLVALPTRPGKAPVTAPPGWKGPGRPGLLHLPIGPGTRPAGRLLLLAPAGRRGAIRAVLTPALLREFGSSVEHVWRLHQRTLRLSVMNDITALRRVVFVMKGGKIYKNERPPARPVGAATRRAGRGAASRTSTAPRR